MAESHVFGIRHHGRGSARSLIHALERLLPDIVLVEGPPDAQHLLGFAASDAMQPPVALLIHEKAHPARAVFYPFASFSPEWQAIRHAARRSVPVRFMDLAQAYRFGLRSAEKAEQSDDGAQDHDGDAQDHEREAQDHDKDDDDLSDDPLSHIARAAGFEDGERWWDLVVESRRDPEGVFEAVLEVMTALRGEIGDVVRSRDPLLERRREAAMRRAIRTAKREGYEQIAVVCGAWHAPALVTLPPSKDDDALLKGLPSVKTEAAWVPWSHGRLTLASGYGAGVASPGWYEHLFERDAELAERWLAKAARLLRDADYDASPASVIESIRLAGALAALRERPSPGLEELNDAALTVLCFGDRAPLRLIETELIVGERLGRIPDDAPRAPLARDLTREQKRLRLPPKAEKKVLDLDLRRELDRERSQLLHRLALLGIEWGVVVEARGKKGTFHEIWNLQWAPDLAVAVVETSRYGNSVHDAATSRATELARRATELSQLTGLFERALLGNLPFAIARVAAFVRMRAALASDVHQLMDALPALASVLRYGDVRQTDTLTVRQIVNELVPRIAVGLPAACTSLADDAAEGMFERIDRTHAAIRLLSNHALRDEWHESLLELAKMETLHGLVAGRVCRLLRDAGHLDETELATRLAFALSAGQEPSRAAAWVDGLLRGSGPLIVHDEALFGILDGWLSSLSAEAYTATLPLLRRTFSTFTAPERRVIGERVRRMRQGAIAARRASPGDASFDETTANAVLPVVIALLGIEAGKTEAS